MQRRRQPLTLSVLVVVIICLFAAGCGRKSSPRPPELGAPAEVVFPTAAGSTGGVILTWQPPVTTENGGSLANLSGFKIFRGEFTKGEKTSFRLLKEIELDPEQPAPADFSYADNTVAPGVTYDYAIEPVNDEGTGGRIAQIIRVSFKGTSSSIEMLAPSANTEID